MAQGARREQQAERDDAAAATREAPAPPSPQSVESLLDLQRTAGNAAVAALMSSRPGAGAQVARDLLPGAGGEMMGPMFGGGLPALQQPPVSPVERAEAERKLSELERSMGDFAREERRWASANWIDFYQRTSANPRLAWTGDVLDGVMSNALGNAVADGAEFVGKRALAKGAAAAGGAAVGGAIGNVPGAIIGFVIGVLIETAVGLIYDAIGGNKEEKAAAAASMRGGELIEKGEQALHEKEKLAAAAARARIDKERQLVNGPTEPGYVRKLTEDAAKEAETTRRNLPNVGERSMADKMLADWVLEHASDENDADAVTSETQWEAAAEKAFGTDDLVGHSEIFAYQSRALFQKIGMNPWAGELLLKEYEALPAVEMVWERKPGHGPERRARSLPRPPAAVVMKALQGRTFRWPKAENPEALIKFVEDRSDDLTERGKRAIREGKFELTCWLRLEEDDGAVYIDHWAFEIKFDEGADWYFDNVAKHTSKLFTHSPD